MENIKFLTFNEQPLIRISKITSIRKSRSSERYYIKFYFDHNVKDSWVFDTQDERDAMYKYIKHVLPIINITLDDISTYMPISTNEFIEDSY